MDGCAGGTVGAEVEGWEEPLHLGSLRRSYPTISHNATHHASFLPLYGPGGRITARNLHVSRHFRGGRRKPSTPSGLQADMQSPSLGAVLRCAQDSAAGCALAGG